VSRPAERRRAAPWWAPPALLAACFAIQLHAYRWGVITPDTVEQYGQALTGRYDDWHPPATAWLWRQLMAFGPGSAPILIFHALLYWTGFALIVEGLRRRGDRTGMALAVLCAVLPIPFGQMGAILKDPLLAAACLCAAGLIFLRGEVAGRGRAFCVAGAAVLLVFASALRFNAVFATAPLFAALLPERWLARPGRALATLIGAAAILSGANRLIDDVALAPHHSRPFFSLLNFDLAGIVAHGGDQAYPDLDPATARAVTAACYDPGLYNPHYRPACDMVEDRLVDWAAAHHQGPVAIWLHAIAGNPVAYARHRLAHLNRNWRLFVPDVPNDAVYAMTTPNDYGLAFTGNRLTAAIGRAARAMALSPAGRPATWLAIALGLLLIGPRLRSRRLVIALAASALLYGSAYALVSVAPDMRYNLWTMLAAVLALVLAISDLRAGGVRGLTRWRLVAAALPVALAIAAEVLALEAGS